ncbi:MAG: hypothetical protein JST30_01550 [Armatimonadetes bacterium]|nr:hypothetical protein [Armatimonadota bacterium]
MCETTSAALGLAMALRAVGLVPVAQEHQHQGKEHQTPPKTQHEGHKAEPAQQHEHHMPGMPLDHGMDSMKGKLGDWMMSKEGSGTSWMPESSPMFMKALGRWGGFDVSLMGMASANYTDAGGKRGDSQFFSTSMVMVMGRREVGGGIFGLQGMFSLDAAFNGKKGYPNLFQTGETENGKPLQDRQHPHDLFAELTASYSHPIGENARFFLYGGPVGEPALGGPMYLHRPSGMENPEAPISHHWFDSTHISFGVLTGGVILGDKLQVEGSWFNDREPDEDRFDFDPIRLNSASGRVTFNPTKEWSLQLSYGFLKEPEALEPGVDQHRLTASAMFSRPMPNGDNFSATAFFGQNIKPDGKTSAVGLEATYFQGPTSYFGRFERVEKDELVGVPPGTHTINKLVLGLTRDFASSGGYDVGIGGFVGLFAFPSELDPFYGKNPVSLGVFVRVRPSQMKHEMPMALRARR